MEVHFSKGITIKNPEARVREYCKIEIYQGYDNCHNMTNNIIPKDIEAANRLFARITPLAAKGLISSDVIPLILEKIQNVDLDEVSDNSWIENKLTMKELLRACLQIPGVGLAVATKVLHLKRPKLIPILDSFVMKFLTGVDISTVSEDASLLECGIDALEIVRKDLINNHEALCSLQKQLTDLPIPVGRIRLYDILCWSTEKWDIRSDPSAPFGQAFASLEKKESPSLEESPAQFEEIRTPRQLQSILAKGNGFIVITDNANPNKIHLPFCRSLDKSNFETKVIVNQCKNGRYYWTDDLKGAMKQFHAQSCSICKPWKSAQ